MVRSANLVNEDFLISVENVITTGKHEQTVEDYNVHQRIFKPLKWNTRYENRMVVYLTQWHVLLGNTFITLELNFVINIIIIIIIIIHTSNFCFALVIVTVSPFLAIPSLIFTSVIFRCTVCNLEQLIINKKVTK